MPARVLVAGGGIAGLATGLALLRLLGPSAVKVTVLERDAGALADGAAVLAAYSVALPLPPLLAVTSWLTVAAVRAGGVQRWTRGRKGSTTTCPSRRSCAAASSCSGSGPRCGSAECSTQPQSRPWPLRPRPASSASVRPAPPPHSGATVAVLGC